MKSQLEIAIAERIRNVKRDLPRYDRAVLVGAMLSCFPMFPACTVGFLIGLANLALLKNGRLQEINKNFIRLSLLIGGFFTVAWLILFFFIDPIGIYFDFYASIKIFLNGIIEKIFYKDSRSVTTLVLMHYR